MREIGASKEPRPFLSADEAAAELGVSKATLYSYVSRGLVRSEPSQTARARRYAAEDVYRLRGRKRADKPIETDADRALAWGAPVLDSAITCIEDGRLYYRGRDATELAEHASLETLARLLWQCTDEDPFAFPLIPPLPERLVEHQDGVAQVQALLAIDVTQYPFAYLTGVGDVPRTGARILKLVTQGFAGAEVKGDEDIHQATARAWGCDEEAADLVRRGLVLCADHELNASTFAVRVVASTKASPYGAVMAGLAALDGPRHGGYTRRVAALFDDASGAGDLSGWMQSRLRRGDKLPGFGHPLYAKADPRAAALLRALKESSYAEKVAWEFELIDAVADLTGRQPNIDVATVMVSRACGLPADAGFILFGIGRTAGWIAHVIEQYQSPRIIRPRARYVGEMPERT